MKPLMPSFNCARVIVGFVCLVFALVSSVFVTLHAYNELFLPSWLLVCWTLMSLFVRVDPNSPEVLHICYYIAEFNPIFACWRHDFAGEILSKPLRIRTNPLKPRMEMIPFTFIVDRFFKNDTISEVCFVFWTTFF